LGKRFIEQGLGLTAGNSRANVANCGVHGNVRIGLRAEPLVASVFFEVVIGALQAASLASAEGFIDPRAIGHAKVSTTHAGDLFRKPRKFTTAANCSEGSARLLRFHVTPT
jgi:hypothetical protein